MSKILSIKKTMNTGTIVGSGSIIYAESFSASAGADVNGTDLKVDFGSSSCNIIANFTAAQRGTAYLIVKENQQGSTTPPTSLDGWKILGAGVNIDNTGKATFNNAQIGSDTHNIGISAFTIEGASTVNTTGATSL